MEPVVLLWVLLSAFFHALWNALLRRDPAPRDAVAPIGVVSAIVSLVAAAFVHAPPRLDTLAFGALAGVFEAAYFLTLGRAHGDMQRHQVIFARVDHARCRGLLPRQQALHPLVPAHTHQAVLQPAVKGMAGGMGQRRSHRPQVVE